MRVNIAPSLMCMDLALFREQLTFLDSRADFLHIDIMDGHYVPNLTLSPFFMKAVKSVSDVPMDAHLMVTDPAFWVPALAEAGAAYITPHAEVINAHAFRIIEMIRAHGCKPGIAINPVTPLSTVEPYLHRLDKLTIMTVDPGYAAQPFIPEVVEKIEAARDFRTRKGLNFLIEIDGSCNRATYARMVNSGADVLVLGTTGLFHRADTIEAAWDVMDHEIKGELPGATLRV